VIMGCPNRARPSILRGSKHASALIAITTERAGRPIFMGRELALSVLPIPARSRYMLGMSGH
jgi:hypothetical protein